MDEPAKVDRPDRKQVSLDEQDLLEHLARKHGVSVEEVREAVRKVGPMRERVEQELMRGSRATDD
jgi:hypothetical protein